MYAAIRRYSKLENIREISRRAEEGFLPIISEVQGFRGYYLIDTGNGSGMTISLFDDQSSAEESTRRAATWVQENIAELVQESPETSTGEVLIQRVM